LLQVLTGLCLAMPLYSVQVRVQKRLFYASFLMSTFFISFAVMSEGAMVASSQHVVDMYFGCGSFWRVQHKLVMAEMQILGRNDAQLTALTGYAGGTGLNRAGRACSPYYSRNADIALSPAKVVGLKVPTKNVGAIAAVFWGLFCGIDRVDVQNIGPQYRAVIGLPGGMRSPLLPEVIAAQRQVVSQPFELKEGRGGDADTLGQALVWVMDSSRFPFHQGEVYNQFHDGIVEKYSSSYHALRNIFLNDCRLVPTGCHLDQSAAKAGCHPLQAKFAKRKPVDSSGAVYISRWFTWWLTWWLMQRLWLQFGRS